MRRSIMKRKRSVPMWLKRTLCLGLICSMAIGLCACGGGGGKFET